MFRCTAFAIILAASFIASKAFADHHETSTPEEFHEFGSLMVGRWSGDITLIADWPGQDKKAGDKIVGYSQRRWCSDEKAIIATTHGGTAVGNELWTYDPIEKRIKIFRVDSGGTFLDLTIWKETSTKWGWKVSGGLPDGQKLGGTGYWVFEDDNQTAILQGDVTLGGKALPKLMDRHVRLDR